jgi:hypothetical protein
MTARLLPEVKRDLSKAIEALTSVYVYENLSPEYGECEARFLCKKFGLTFRDLKCEYRQLNDTQRKVVGPTLHELLNVKGASAKLICSSLRTRVTVRHMPALMFISLRGPPVDLWQPMKFVKLWLTANRRAADSMQGLNEMLILRTTM